MRTYFTGPTQIEEKWEVLGAYMAGSIFPKTGIYDEQSTAIIVEESDMQLGSNLLPRDFTILTDRMLRELIKFGDKSQPVTLYSSSTQNQISYGFRGKHLPPSELLPFTFTSSYRSGLIERILNDTKGEEKPDNYGFTPSWDDDY